MRFVACLIVGLSSLKWLGMCSEIPELNYTDENISYDMTSKSFNNESAFYVNNVRYLALSILKNNSLSSITEEFVKEEPLISAPLFENISWNTSAPQQLNRKRDLPESGGLSYENKMQILQLHNIYRSNVTPPAGNMAFMEWDEELSRLAQIWADRCEFEHGMPENEYPETIGQNLYIGTDPTGYLGLYMWYEEYHNYDLRKQYCLPNTQCGHYVQMAWAASNKLGCAMTKCGMRYFLTCHYSPQALKGVQMYHVAKPCSQCSSKDGALCIKNLCMTQEQCKVNPFDCHFASCNLECHNCGRLNKKNCLCECANGWDSPDCSHLCVDKHPRCGKSPGWPSKATCSLNRHAVAETYCRKMCEMCRPLDSEESNHTCCNNLLCEEGHVLDIRENKCGCNLLCPGPMCDSKDEGIIMQASLESSSIRLTVFPLLMISVIIFYLYEVRREAQI